jgi:DNA repair exonuclease SbcCD nuclease subunit
MRILHFADVHLDRPFVGLSAEAARRRRNEIREAFERCLEAAREKGVDLVTIGGDLWEDEHVTADTRKRVAQQLEELDLPVLLVCGNHDRLKPGGNYERTPWPRNVRIFGSEGLQEEPFDEASVWGTSWGTADLSASFLNTFHAPDDRRAHVLLLHGTATPLVFLTGDDYCGFDPKQIEDAGLALCLAGHIHQASQVGRVVYPGSSEPLGWGETGRHCYALVEIENGEATVELHDVNRFRYAEVRVECSDATSSHDIEQRLAKELGSGDPNLYQHVTLVGDVAPDCEVDRTHLVSLHAGNFAGLRISDETRPGYDYKALAALSTVDGLFVRTLQGEIETATFEERAQLELALQAGLRAIDGRKDLIDVA